MKRKPPPDPRKMTWRNRQGGFTGREGTAYLGVAKDITGGRGQTHTMQLNDPFTGQVVEIEKALNPSHYQRAWSMANPTRGTKKNQERALKLSRRIDRKMNSPHLSVAKGDGIVRATGTVAPIMPRGNPYAGKGQKLLHIGGGRKKGNSTALLRIHKK